MYSFLLLGLHILSVYAEVHCSFSVNITNQLRERKCYVLTTNCTQEICKPVPKDDCEWRIIGNCSDGSVYYSRTRCLVNTEMICKGDHPTNYYGYNIVNCNVSRCDKWKTRCSDGNTYGRYDTNQDWERMTRPQKVLNVVINLFSFLVIGVLLLFLPTP